MNCRLSSQQVRAWCCRPEPLLADPGHDLACTEWWCSYFGRCQPCTCAVMHPFAAHATLIRPNRVVEENKSVCSARSASSFFRILLVLAVPPCPLARHSSLGQIGIGIVSRAPSSCTSTTLSNTVHAANITISNRTPLRPDSAYSRVNDAALDLIADLPPIHHAVRRHRQQPWPA